MGPASGRRPPDHRLRCDSADVVSPHGSFGVTREKMRVTGENPFTYGHLRWSTKTRSDSRT
jgi:hypothetical protein